MRFFISATKNIAAGTEISIPFSYDYRKWYEQILCFSVMHFLTIGSILAKTATSLRSYLPYVVLSMVLFLPVRDYFMFGSLLLQFRLSSVMLVHPTQGVEPFGKISSPLCTLAIL